MTRQILYCIKFYASPKSTTWSALVTREEARLLFFAPYYRKTWQIMTDGSCFHDYGQELALSLLYYLEIGQNHRQM